MKTGKSENQKTVLINGVKVPLTTAERLVNTPLTEALKPKVQAATTPPTNRTMSIEEFQRRIDNGDVESITLPTNDMAKLMDFVSLFVKADRVQFLIELHQKTIDKCYKCFYSDTSPEIQKVYQLIDIARVDMMIQAIIRLYGNQALPKSLQDWKPVFGLHWQMRATALITSKQSDWENNLFWYSTYKDMISGAIEESETVVKNIQDQEIKFPLKAESVSSVKIIHAEDMLMIDTGIHRHTFNWDELDAFYNKKEKKPNHLATILQDLQSDLDGCLRADGGVLYNQFAKEKSNTNSQISKLTSALDSIIFIQNDRAPSSSDRWFKKTDKYSYTRWYPRFVSIRNQMSKLAEGLVNKAGEMDETSMEKVLNAVGQADHPALKIQGAKPISMKKWRTQEQYQDDVDDVFHWDNSRLDRNVPD